MGTFGALVDHRQRAEVGRLSMAAARADLVWVKPAALLLDALFVVSLLFTILGWVTVLSFHVSFASLTLMSFAHAGRAFVYRTIPGVIAVTAVVARSVDVGRLQTDELYEIPILVIMMAFAAWSVQLHRALVDRLQAQSERLRDLHQASQIEAREQLLLTQRVETFGQLSAGLAHNCRNLLTTILSVAERMEDTTTDSEVQGAARQIQGLSQQGGQLIGDMLHSVPSHHGTPDADLSMIVGSELSSLEILLGRSIDLTVDLVSEPLVVQTSENLLEQLLINLALNARDAIDGAGQIRITTGRTTLAQPHTGGDAIAAAVLTIWDDGSGISEEVRARAFEPFFTTKADSTGGTGLGLYTSLMIAEDAGGTIRFSSDSSEGTEVVVTLPLKTETVTPARRGELDLRAENLFGSETVLVIDDDEYIRHRLCTTLALYGYDVIEAPDAATVWQEAAGRSLDLIVSDVLMPETTGPALVQELRTKGVDVPVLFISGFDEASGLLPDQANLLPKPFSRNVFLARVREALVAAGAEPRKTGSGRRESVANTTDGSE